MNILESDVDVGFGALGWGVECPDFPKGHSYHPAFPTCCFRLAYL